MYDLKLLILEQSIKKLIRSVSKKLGNRFTILIGVRVGVKQSGTCKSCRSSIVFQSNFSYQFSFKVLLSSRHNASMRNLNQPDMEISCHLFFLTVKDQERIILFYERISSYKSEQNLTK